MKRRNFLKISGLASLGAVFFSSDVQAKELEDIGARLKKAKNLIFMVSDGMSNGTLTLTDLYSRKILNKPSTWLSLYEKNKVVRGLMDMSSANSSVTDSAAASSSWGGGKRVNNGSINVDSEGNFIKPLWEKFKERGKLAGCVTTVPITHATPAGFTVSVKSRSNQSLIAEKYLEKKYDVLMGGGQKYFDTTKRKDNKDMLSQYQANGYFIAQNKSDLAKIQKGQKILGVFSEDALPYYIDRKNDASIEQNIPTLAEMTKVAIEQMKEHKNGFVLQVESGKVDWAAHANDIGALIYEQLQFDEALQVAIDFAEKDGDTLVVFTTDHGNANPGLIYGKNVDESFVQISNYTCSNEFLLNQLSENDTVEEVQTKVQQFLKISLTEEEANEILSYYKGIIPEDNGLYNYKKLPYALFSDIQKIRNHIGWISMDHSSDYVEIAAFGKNKQLVKAFQQNIDLHDPLLNHVK